jgi:hypothetical protein
MTKPNYIIIPVCIGFILSFIIGLLSSVSFGVVLLRALFFAVLFGVLGFGIGIVFRRFLLESSDLDGGTDVSGGARQGSVVDLSIGDEPLEEDENGPDFYVRKDISSSGHVQHSEKNSVDNSQATELAKTANVMGGDASQSQFKPITLGASTAVASQEGSGTPPGTSVNRDDDILPEIGDLSMIGSTEEEVAPAVGMDIPIANGMETSQGRSNAGTSSDSHTIAQAIRTVLARDS